MQQMTYRATIFDSLCIVEYCVFSPKMQRQIFYSISFLLDSDRSKSKKKKKRSEKPRQRSISPLSRRMAMFSDGNLAEGGSHGNNSAYNYPPMFSAASSSDAAQMPTDYDLRVSKFLDATRDEDNYEEKVRKFVEEASKYKKERKNQESKKKDRKKSKKNKKDTKKKKKEKKSKSSKKDKDDVIDGNELREALKYVLSLKTIHDLSNSIKNDFRIITKLPLFDFNAKKLSDIEMNVEKSLNQLKEEYVTHFDHVYLLAQCSHLLIRFGTM